MPSSGLQGGEGGWEGWARPSAGRRGGGRQTVGRPLARGGTRPSAGRREGSRGPRQAGPGALVGGRARPCQPRHRLGFTDEGPEGRAPHRRYRGGRAAEASWTMIGRASGTTGSQREIRTRARRALKLAGPGGAVPGAPSGPCSAPPPASPAHTPGTAVLQQASGKGSRSASPFPF